MAGSRGPVPKPQAQRRRRNKPEVEMATAPPGASPRNEAPEPDPEWHPIAREWFEALGRSGQVVFFEASDWAQARYLAHMMDQTLQADKPNGQLVSSVLSGSTELLTTEGARRRLRIELAKADAGPSAAELAATADMAAYRKRLGGE